MLYNIFFYYQLETNNFAEQNIIPFIPFFPTLVNLSWLFCISLGVRDKLDIGTVKCFLVRRFIDCKLSDNKDIEQERSIKFYQFCILRSGSKEELLLTVVLKVCKACGSFWCLKSSTE